MSALGQHMAAEIAESPEIYARILAHKSEISEIAQAIAARKPHTVLFAGRGTSDHACIYGKYLVEVDLGLAAGLISPSSMTIYGATPKCDGVLLVAVSQSGGSPDLVESARVARAQGATVLAITNTATSPLAQAAEFHIDVHAGVETAVAATKSYNAQLLTLLLFVEAWLGRTNPNIQKLPELAAQVVGMSSKFDEIAAQLMGIERLIVTGRGFAYPTALEAALKIMETLYIDAHAFSTADLLHGPMAMLSDEMPVFAMAPDGLGFDAMKPALERISATTNKLFVFGGAASSGYGNHNLTIDHNLGEKLSPMLDIIALQNVIVRMAVNAGNDPDSPRGLKKVTETL